MVVPTTDHGLCTHPCAQLNLSYNKLDSKAAEALAPALIQSQLTRLDVSHNCLDRHGQGVNMLREAVRERIGFTLLATIDENL